MGVYETELGYIVTETIDGLDVTENDEFVCELQGVSLNDYRFSGDDDDYSEINDDLLESDIKEQIAVDDFLNCMNGL
jgi:hypothetical protein